MAKKLHISPYVNRFNFEDYYVEPIFRVSNRNGDPFLVFRESRKERIRGRRYRERTTK